eukprot:3711610-Alexandrium_andersonii.AAC.1
MSSPEPIPLTIQRREAYGAWTNRCSGGAPLRNEKADGGTVPAAGGGADAWGVFNSNRRQT